MLNTSIFFFLLFAFISCNQDVKKQSSLVELKPISEVTTLPFPKNGFSNGYIDKTGNLWFSSNGGGLYGYNGKEFIHYTKENGLNSNHIYSIIADSKNNLWLGTKQGISKFNGKEFKHIPLPFQDTTSVWLDKVYPVINPNAACALELDNHNNLWIGTAGGGVYSFNGEYFKPYLREVGRKQEDSLYHNWVPYIEKDKKGNLWFASMTHGGVHKFNGKEFTQFLSKDGLSDNQIRTIYSDKSDHIWFGFNGNRNSGLTVYYGNEFKTFSKEDGLCNTRIRSIFKDQTGSFWLGAGKGNLCIFDGQSFTEFNYKGKTFSDILFVLGDSKNNIWFGGTHGIWKFDGKNLFEIMVNSL